MSTTMPAAAVKRPGAFRRRFPWTVVTMALLAVVLLWTWPAPDLEKMWRVVGTQAALGLAFLLLLFWALFLSPFSRAARVGILLAVVLAGGAFAATVRLHSFDGDMIPILLWRWARPHDDLLEQHRREQRGDALSPVQLTDLPTDFPAYRGRLRDGVVTGPALARDWTASLPRLLWKQPVGGGYSAFAVAGNLAVTQEQRRDQEAVVAYDTATGRERWAHAYTAQFREKMGGEGPRATPTIADGGVYALGATGLLCCLDARTGQPRWQVDILEGNDNLPWGMSGAPLVYDDVVVVSPGKQRPTGHTLVAYDRATGKQRWASGEAQAGYSSPQLATLGGQRQILLLDGDGLAGYDAATGKELWRHAWETQQHINVAQPVVLDGDRVFISSGYGVGCAMLQITFVDGKWVPRVLWLKRTMRCKFTSPVARQGFLYGLDEGILVCLDAQTGDRRWREGRYGHGQLLRADDLLLILGEAGELALVEASPTAYRELGRLEVFNDKTWNTPAVADGKAYLRNHQEMACYDLTTPAARADLARRVWQVRDPRGTAGSVAGETNTAAFAPAQSPILALSFPTAKSSRLSHAKPISFTGGFLPLVRSVRPAPQGHASPALGLSPRGRRIEREGDHEAPHVRAPARHLVVRLGAGDGMQPLPGPGSYPHCRIGTGQDAMHGLRFAPGCTAG